MLTLVIEAESTEEAYAELRKAVADPQMWIFTTSELHAGLNGLNRYTFTY